jgi:hypothetical protein
MTNIHIKLQDSPSIHGFDPAVDAGLPTDEQLGIIQNKTVDNYGIIVKDPANWFIFDPGVENSNISWAKANPNPGRGELMFTNPGAYINVFRAKGTQYTLNRSGGPRGLGFTTIDEKTWIRINNYVGYQDYYGNFQDPRTEIWKQGSIEFTLKPTKQNCTIISGTNFPVNNGPYALRTQAPGAQTYSAYIEDGNSDESLPQNADKQLIEFPERQGKQEVSAFFNGFKIVNGVVFPDPAAGITLSDDTEAYRTFGVDLVNGIIRIRYDYHYGSKRSVEIFGKTNLIDGNWHHVVINRPSPFTEKAGDNEYGGDGCLEIWVDGKLENRTFDITATDSLPAPQVLFNDSLNPGVLNTIDSSYMALSLNASWIEEESVKTNYVGGIRDYIYRQITPLTPHQVNQNYAYAMLNTNQGRLIKASEKKANALLVMPTITSNKPKVLKLYWNNLLKDKEKCLNGLEFDDSYDVYSYSVTSKNILPPSETFNLDVSKSLDEKFFLPDVKTAIGRHTFIGGPGIILTSPDQNTQLDAMNEARIAGQNFGDRYFMSNVLYGGVELSEGDLILLFNQPKTTNNGIWQYYGPKNPLRRPQDISNTTLENGYVYVTSGKYANKTFVQLNPVSHIRTSPQKWIEVDNEVSLASPKTYPVHSGIWSDNFGNQSFIDVNQDIDIDYDIIAFMNYPTESSEILSLIEGSNEVDSLNKYSQFLTNLKTAVNNGKSLYVSSPMLAVDLGIVDNYVEVSQLLNETGDAQSASISPFESGELAENYFDTHRNIKYSLATPINGLTNKETYIMSDFVTYSPDRLNSDYHIKYNYRQFGLLEGDEFLIPGLTTVPETLNGQLPGYLYNQRGTGPIAAFPQGSINLGTMVTKFSTSIYDGSNAITNPYNDYATTIAVIYGSGKIFVNCVENGYTFSRSDYNTGIIQNVTAGQNSETVQTAAWQYSTKRLNKKNLYDFSEISNLIGQTTPTDGGGGAIVQSQSHCSNGVIRKNTNQGDLQYQSDLYSDFTEEIFETTKIPVLSMTWLGLKWLAE